jgi:hypothetical protein
MARHSTPLFTRRHYEWLAAFARAELPMGDRVALCNALDHEGFRFNRARWEKASGISEWGAGHATMGTDPRQPRGVRRVLSTDTEGEIRARILAERGPVPRGDNDPV